MNSNNSNEDDDDDDERETTNSSTYTINKKFLFSFQKIFTIKQKKQKKRSHIKIEND